MQEGWIDTIGNLSMRMDCEESTGGGGLNHHPSIAGSFFAARLSISEHLNKIKKRQQF